MRKPYGHRFPGELARWFMMVLGLGALGGFLGWATHRHQPPACSIEATNPMPDLRAMRTGCMDRETR